MSINRRRSLRPLLVALVQPRFDLFDRMRIDIWEANVRLKHTPEVRVLAHLRNKRHDVPKMISRTGTPSARR